MSDFLPYIKGEPKLPTLTDVVMFNLLHDQAVLHQRGIAPLWWSHMGLDESAVPSPNRQEGDCNILECVQ